MKVGAKKNDVYVRILYNHCSVNILYILITSVHLGYKIALILVIMILHGLVTISKTLSGEIKTRFKIIFNHE